MPDLPSHYTAADFEALYHHVDVYIAGRDEYGREYAHGLMFCLLGVCLDLLGQEEAVLTARAASWLTPAQRSMLQTLAHCIEGVQNVAGSSRGVRGEEAVPAPTNLPEQILTGLQRMRNAMHISELPLPALPHNPDGLHDRIAEWSSAEVERLLLLLSVCLQHLADNGESEGNGEATWLGEVMEPQQKEMLRTLAQNCT